MPNPVTHFEIVGQDGKALQDFYANLFGWKVDASNPMNYGMVEAQDGKGATGGISTGQGTESYVTVYVEVDDPQTYLDKAVSMGGQVTMPVTEITEFVILAQFRDPAGNLIGITKAGYPA